MPDTNFKDQDPKKQYNTPENPKDRSGSYDAGQDFDPTHGFDDHPDDYATTDMVSDEDRFMAGNDDGELDDEEDEFDEDELDDEDEFDDELDDDEDEED